MTRCSGIPVGCAAATASRAGRAVSRQRTGPIPRAMIVYCELLVKTGCWYRLTGSRA